MRKVRSQSFATNLCIIAICVSTVLMIIFYESGTGIFNFTNLFLLIWIIAMVVAFFSGAKKWSADIKMHIKRKNYYAIIVQIAAFMLILTIMILSVNGLVKAIIKNN